MARKQNSEVESQERDKLEAAKAQLLESAQELTFKNFISNHRGMALAGAFFTGILLGGSMRAQDQMRDAAVQSIKKEVLRKIWKQQR